MFVVFVGFCVQMEMLNEINLSSMQIFFILRPSKGTGGSYFDFRISYKVLPRESAIVRFGGIAGTANIHSNATSYTFNENEPNEGKINKSIFAFTSQFESLSWLSRACLVFFSFLFFFPLTYIFLTPFLGLSIHSNDCKSVGRLMFCFLWFFIHHKRSVFTISISYFCC